MNGNIPGGNFSGDFPGGCLMGGNLQVGIFREPSDIYISEFTCFRSRHQKLLYEIYNLDGEIDVQQNSVKELSFSKTVKF